MLIPPKKPRKAPKPNSTFKKPLVPGGLCWNCDRRLYAGGRSYKMVEIDGVMRPVHKHCYQKPG
jgi:hypothetical protein